ncbi:MAG: amidohydrolase [Chloroflexi bacterium]|nr:amidohydrolase [Chloroflexota bacterium]
MLIDFHTHVYQEAVADKVIGGMESFYGVKRRHDATVKALLDSMRGVVDKAVVLPVLTKPEHIELNRWYAGLASESKGKIVPFGGLHPENHPSELDVFPDLGLRGLKLQPNAQRFYPDDEHMFPIYRKAEELGLMVLFHAGNEASGPPAEYSQPKRFVPVLENFPGLTVILPHLGGYEAWSDVPQLFAFGNVYFDTAYLPGKIDEALFVELIERAGIERILFGTDFPFRDAQEEAAWTTRVLGPAKLRKLHENAIRLLGL